MNIFLTVVIVLLVIAVVALAIMLVSLQARIAQLTDKLNNGSATSNDTAIKGFELRLQELSKGLTDNSEKFDREFNTLWAELENHRQELLARIDGGLTAAQWRAVLEQRISSFAEIKIELTTLMSLNPDLAAQLRENLPVYLFDDEILPGLLDYARMPFERINWLDQLIMPVSAKLDHQQDSAGPEASHIAIAKSFNALIAAIGYQTILPNNGEVYRPDYHEVIEQRLSHLPRGTILATRARGFGQDGAILRKAKVIISAGQS